MNTGRKTGSFGRARFGGVGLGRVAGAAVLGLLAVGCPTGGTLEDPDCYTDGPDCMTPSTDGTGGDTAGGTGGDTAGPACDTPAVFAAKCGTQFCHGSGTGSPPIGGVELVTPPAGMTLGESLLNEPAVYPSGGTACPADNPELIINGASPATSLLLTKTNGTGFACGDEMPPGVTYPQLTADEKTCLVTWINDVAAADP